MSELDAELDAERDIAPARRRSGALRGELSARNLARAQVFTHETTWSSQPSVVYAEDDSKRHGNFFPASYRRILQNPAWRGRLGKAYTASRRIAHAELRSRRELDCAASSDALLMSIFCHPTALRSPGLRAMLALSAAPNAKLLPHFGVRARVPLRGGFADRTELDMVLAPELDSEDCLSDLEGCLFHPEDCLFVEAKLTESDFQSARPQLLERYAGFESCFETALLPRNRGHFRSYQLLRDVMAAQHHGARFLVMLDARRSDLLEDAYLVYRAVPSATLRSRLHVVTWQEIALFVGRPMQRFLEEKYGIVPA